MNTPIARRRSINIHGHNHKHKKRSKRRSRRSSRRSSIYIDYLEDIIVVLLPLLTISYGFYKLLKKSELKNCKQELIKLRDLLEKRNIDPRTPQRNIQKNRVTIDLLSRLISQFHDFENSNTDTDTDTDDESSILRTIRQPDFDTDTS
jgi:hypothetical protein